MGVVSDMGKRRGPQKKVGVLDRKLTSQGFLLGCPRKLVTG